MNVFDGFEQAALTVLKREAERTSVDPEAMDGERALYIVTVGRNRRPDPRLPPLDS